MFVFASYRARRNTIKRTCFDNHNCRSVTTNVVDELDKSLKPTAVVFFTNTNRENEEQISIMLPLSTLQIDSSMAKAVLNVEQNEQSGRKGQSGTSRWKTRNAPTQPAEIRHDFTRFPFSTATLKRCTGVIFCWNSNTSHTSFILAPNCIQSSPWPSC